MAGWPLFVYPDSPEHQISPAGCRSHSFKKIDSNGDGKLRLNELKKETK
jgi:hypothetical protein